MKHCRKILSIFFHFKDIKQIFLFLLVLSILMIAFIIYLFKSMTTLENSQAGIKQSYVEHLYKADSLYLSLINYNKDLTCELLSYNARAWSDSLINASLKGNSRLSESQYKNLSKLLSDHFGNIESFHKNYDAKIQRDSLLISVEKNLLEGQTKSMIDLHLNKIEHEYSNITMWAAVLTILFLVFSFYSIFKMDEFIQQGTEGVKEIRQLRHEGNDAINTIKARGDKLLTDTGDDVQRFMSDQQNRLIEFNKTIESKTIQIQGMIEEQQKTLLAAKDTFDEQSLPIIHDFESQMKGLVELNGQILERNQSEFNSLIAQTHEILKSLKKQKFQKRNYKAGR